MCVNYCHLLEYVGVEMVIQRVGWNEIWIQR